MQRELLSDYKTGEHVEAYALIKESEVKEARNGKHYLSLTVGDKSGEINGKIWQVSPDADKHYPTGAVVYVQGERGEYNGVPQINYHNVKVIDDGRDEGNPELYIKTAPMNSDTMQGLMKEKLDKITDPDIKKVVRSILNRYNERLFSHPAASRNHHAFYGGLAYHTVSMLNLAESVLGWYEGLNKSLLYGAIIIHDVCKIDEMTGTQEGSEYTKKGKLLGHIVMIEDEIVRTASELGIDPDSEMILMLRHMVLSHHGKKEWGSPVKPQLREAWALHYIDMLDASMNAAKESLNSVEDGEFSAKVWSLDKTELYQIPGRIK